MLCYVYCHDFSQTLRKQFFVNIIYTLIKNWIPANTPGVFHVETTWKRRFSRRFNVEYTWCVCRDEVFLESFNLGNFKRTHDN